MGRKKEEDDDGGQTRCVCNQQHHEGVMIQCETCKVWQHCPCVGLGDGEVTPDKYYCDSCRPENHPYRVVNGQLVSKSSSSLKPTKKRSTMNSKEASIPMDLMLAQQKWNEEHQDELEEEFIQRTASKRRKKTSSNITDNDETVSKELISTTAITSTSSTDKKKEKHGLAPNDQESSSSNSSPSPKTSSSNLGRMGSKKSSTSKSTFKARSRSISPVTNGVDVRNNYNNDTMLDEFDSKRTVTVDDSTPSTKRRKTSSRQDILHSEPCHTENAEESKNEPTDLANPRSRKLGNGSRPNSKRSHANNSDDVDYTNEDSSPANAPKRSSTKRSGERSRSSRHSTPTPVNEGTPQPMAPAPPATIRYPSSKMSIHEMSKRAKQLLDYISRVQIDMADRMGKTASQSNSPETEGRPQVTPNSHHDDQKDAETKDDAILFRLPASASSIIHGDSQVCPDLSRSSMESTTSSYEPSSPVDIKVPIQDACSDKEMTIKVIPMSSCDTVPLLSTPPLSVHDHRDQQHRDLSSGTPESEATHEPLTPPHQPSDEQQRLEGGELGIRTTESNDSSTKTEVNSLSSFDLMDKLTGDLIRFQERFGAYS
ncbi:hypothetical protein BGZ76_002228 [Entomortierella beljakovae]|nr:hypothetical protein BGZ76_002228 [Entomortierella beljakovae]